MNTRILQIMSILAKNNYCSLTILADQFKVTERTIRYDIKKINDFLNKNHISPVILDKSGKITIDSDFYQYQKHIVPDDYYSYKLSKDERILIASIMLLSRTKYITIASIADYLSVSRTTCINDLHDIKKFLSRFNISLISHPSKGLRIQGNELDIREELLRIFLSTNQTNKLSPLRLFDFKNFLLKTIQKSSLIF